MFSKQLTQFYDLAHFLFSTNTVKPYLHGRIFQVQTALSTGLDGLWGTRKKVKMQKLIFTLHSDMILVLLVIGVLLVKRTPVELAVKGMIVSNGKTKPMAHKNVMIQNWNQSGREPLSMNGQKHHLPLLRYLKNIIFLDLIFI